MTLRTLIRELTPPLLLRAGRRAGRARGLRFEGDYASWEDARKASSGYDSADVLNRVFEAEMKVRDGQAADARDGVCFDRVQYSLPVMAALARAAVMRDGVLRVLDYGGALGGSYRHFKTFLPPARVDWVVVEQPHYVELGKTHFQGSELRFAPTLDDALRGRPADVVLLSSVLQYLPAPYQLLRQLAAAAIPRMVIDRTPCSALARDVLAVQTVPPQIYPASYPCWIFSRQRVLGALESTYALVGESADASGRWESGQGSFVLAGFILDLRR